MKLKLGKMTGHEIAEWMGIAYSTYKRSPTKYIQLLEDYCKFQQVWGGVVIEEIYLYEYRKNLKLELTETFIEVLCENNGVLALSGLENTGKMSTYHGRKVQRRLFGDKPTNLDASAHGLLGTRERVWMIKLGENQYRDFTPKEEELFDTLIEQNYIDKMTPAAIKARELILECCVREGYSASEYQEMLTKRKYNFFNDVIVKFRELTGYQIGSPTKHEICADWCQECSEEDLEYKEYLYNLLTEIRGPQPERKLLDEPIDFDYLAGREY